MRNADKTPADPKQTESRLEADLALLRSRFDERLATLRKPYAGERLRSVMQRPAKLYGRVKAGQGY